VDEKTGNIDCGQHFNCDINKSAWNLAFGVPQGNAFSFMTSDEAPYQLFITKEILCSIDKKLYTLPYKTFISWCEKDRKKDSRQYLSAVNPDFRTVQDEKKVTVETVGIETTVFEDHILLVLHFYYKLFFPAKKNSTVQNSYLMNANVLSGRHSSVYQTEYDISTGGTWKDSIKNFVLVTNGLFERSGGNTQNSFEISPLYLPMDDIEKEYEPGGTGYTVCCIKDYKPVHGEFFKFTFGDIVDEFVTSLRWVKRKNNSIPEKNIVQDFVKDISSSSFLSGSFKISDYDDNKTASGYSPLASFDGFIENGWVEGASGDGTGEWIQFTLTKPVFGPFAVKGLNRDIDTYTNNKRIKQAGLYKGTEKIATLLFTDKPVNFSSDLTWQKNDVWLMNNAVQNTMFLDTGTYRIKIESVYNRYAKYNDTVLGEVWFYPVGPVLIDIAMHSEFCAGPLLEFLHKNMWTDYDIEIERSKK
jgi:hypothetical protein